MSIVYESKVNTIHRADARKVAAEQEAGSFSLAVLDGPYGMRKAAWDMMKVSGLPEWYAPHLDDVGRLCADSASLYVWNTAEGWATLHPGIVARGWTFRSLVTWDKMTSPAMMAWRTLGGWPDHTEVCGVYQRGRPTHTQPDGATGNVWRFSTKRLGMETIKGEVGPARFADREPCLKPLHPSQKPITFADRIIRASSRPGERVWVPFGGTCREAVAAEWMARAEPGEARQVVTCEIDEDGRDYLVAVVRQLRGEDVRPKDPRQTGLFGGGS